MTIDTLLSKLNISFYVVNGKPLKSLGSYVTLLEGMSRYKLSPKLHFVCVLTREKFRSDFLSALGFVVVGFA